jgi:hypothetical protein
MEIPILIEPVANNGFRAAVGSPLDLQTDAPTRDEAVAKLRQLVTDRIQAGAEVTTLAIPSKQHPLARFAGMLKDDPLLDEWKAAMREYREQRDSGVDDA